MHPAFSIILFTSLSGLGFGLLFWLGIGRPMVDGWVALVFFAIAFALSVGGLVSSTFHLGNPQRALKAFTQWKTSWLSREAWLATFTLICAGLYALSVIFEARVAVLGWITALGAVLTVLATAMIYAQLNTVPRWKGPQTPLMFLILALAGGALLGGQVTAALVLLIIAGVVQIIVCLRGDGAFSKAGSSMESATGLGGIGAVRMFESPHTGTNYLMTEMGHRVARKHALKLRVIAILLMVVLPVILLLLPFGHLLAAIAVLSHILGLLVSRWLFFAEAEHVMGLYYGLKG